MGLMTFAYRFGKLFTAPTTTTIFLYIERQKKRGRLGGESVCEVTDGRANAFYYNHNDPYGKGPGK